MQMPHFEKFMPNGEGNVGARWKKWTTRFELFLHGMNITSPSRKKSLLIHYAGEEVFNIYDTFTPAQKGDQTEQGYSTLTQSLSAYFEPQKNLAYEVYKFRQAKQETSESIDNFCTRLRHLSSTCEFADNDIEIKNQIVQGCVSQRLRRRALREDLTLDDLLKAARALELSDEQAVAMESQNANVNAINKKKPVRHQPQYRAPPHQQQHQNVNRTHRSHKFHDNSKQASYKPPHQPFQTSSYPCAWCGGPRHPKDKCPASDKFCSYCSKPGHFAKVCHSRRKQQQPPNARNIHVKSIHEDFSAMNLISTPTPNPNFDSDSEQEYIFSINHDNSPQVQISLQDRQVPFIIDTGASCNVIDEKSFLQLNNISLSKPTSKLFAYGDSNPLHVIGVFESLISYNDTSVNAKFHVVRSTTTSGNLLSANTAKALNLIQFAFQTSDSISNSYADNIFKKHPSLFEGLGKMKDSKVTLHIDENVQPVAQPHRRIPFHMRKKVEQEIQRLEQLDIIEKVDGPTPWVSPIVCVPKPKSPSEIRLCVDMRVPNAAIKRTRHIMPTIDDLLMRLNGSTVFTKLDLNQGYHQLELDEQSRNITTFSTHVGLRRYKRLNFGVTSAAEIFQNIIAETISDIPHAINSSDDILVDGVDQKSHDETLEKVLQRLKERGFTLNKPKCLFSQSSIEFYGFIFGKDGISADPKKVQSVNQMSPPTNQKEVRSFLGMINCFTIHSKLC